MKKRFSLLIGTAAAVLFLAVGMMIRIAEIPNVIFLTNGSTRTLDYNLPFSAHIEKAAEDVVKFSGTSLKDVGKYDMNEPLTLATENSGSTSISLDLFGLIPVKDIDVMVREEIMLYPGGQSIGVMLYTDGALVVGSSVVECADGTQINPSEAAGLEAGDIIRAVDGVKVENAKHLALLVNETKEHKLTLTVERDDMEKQLLIEAAEDSAGEWKLGVWVRDSTAGVGTLTFYDPESGAIAGLGHAITDVDTGSMLRVKNGEIILSEVTEVVKGKEGEPGDLKGLFDPREEVIGYISENTEFGIFGKGEMSIENGLCGPIPAGSRDELKEGEATIYASVDDSGVKEYSCRISEIAKHRSREQKNFVVTITDEELLERTGGIVQGMSGSPIIQDGKLVGAVTHVLVNDPTRGYGIFIENMLEAAG